MRKLLLPRRSMQNVCKHSVVALFTFEESNRSIAAEPD